MEGAGKDEPEGGRGGAEPDLRISRHAHGPMVRVMGVHGACTLMCVHMGKAGGAGRPGEEGDSCVLSKEGMALNMLHQRSRSGGAEPDLSISRYARGSMVREGRVVAEGSGKGALGGGQGGALARWARLEDWGRREEAWFQSRRGGTEPHPCVMPPSGGTPLLRRRQSCIQAHHCSYQTPASSIAPLPCSPCVLPPSGGTLFSMRTRACGPSQPHLLLPLSSSNEDNIMFTLLPPP